MPETLIVERVVNIVDNILFIENEHSKILDYIANIENQRRNALLIVQSFSNEVFTSGSKEKLINKLVNLKFKVSRDIHEKVDNKEKRECRYYHRL